MTNIRRLDDCLSVRDGRLWIEEQDTVELVRRFGSPLFVVSEDQLRRNVRRFREAFARGWPDGPVKVMPAAKAAWITAVQRVLASEGCGCDVYSAGELAVALKAGFDPPSISVNGVPKDDRHIRRSVEAELRNGRAVPGPQAVPPAAARPAPDPVPRPASCLRPHPRR